MQLSIDEVAHYKVRYHRSCLMRGWWDKATEEYLGSNRRNAEDAYKEKYSLKDVEWLRFDGLIRLS